MLKFSTLNLVQTVSDLDIARIDADRCRFEYILTVAGFSLHHLGYSLLRLPPKGGKASTVETLSH